MTLPPKFLPEDIVDFITLEAPSEAPLVLFVKGIDLFLKEFHHSAYPPNTPPRITEPLENNQ